jgi:hypothetical protein
MRACVQQISYDLTAGRTTLTFGPAAHLGAKDFVERLRINRGPRWYNLNGNNVQNAPNQNAGSQLGQDVSQLNPTHGPKINTSQTPYPISLADQASHSGAYTDGVPGITFDSSTSQPNYGGISGLSAPALPTIFLAGGSGGAISAPVRISVTDAFGKAIWLQEYPCYFNFNDGNGCVAAYVLLLGSYPYTTSVHA